MKAKLARLLRKIFPGKGVVTVIGLHPNNSSRWLFERKDKGLYSIDLTKADQNIYKVHDQGPGLEETELPLKGSAHNLINNFITKLQKK